MNVIPCRVRVTVLAGPFTAAVKAGLEPHEAMKELEQAMVEFTRSWKPSNPKLRIEVLINEQDSRVST